MSGDVYEVTMPKLGETVTEGVVSQWLKQPGDTIAFDDPLFEVSTDKVDSEVPSPYDGVLLEILVNEGDTVPVGTPIARIGEPGAATPTAAAPDAAAPESSEPATGPAAVPLPQAGNGQAGVPLSPVVRRLAAENDIDLSTVTGSGAGGRIRREDVEQAIAARPFPTTPAAAHAAPPGVPGPAPAAATAPSAATAPATTPPTPAAAPALAPPAAAQAPPAAAAKAASAVAPGGEVDFENVERVRQRHKDQFKKSEGVSLTYLPFVARAVCDALREYPAVNSSIDIEAQTMTFHHYVNLGISVDLDQQGLMAPVVKNADALNLRGLARSMATLAAAARSRTLSPADLSGSTFTITNPGPSASYASAPVINQPNVAILATDGIARRPVAVGDAIAIHHTGILGFSYDHRAFDGSTASLFLQYIRDALQDRAWEAEFS